MYVYVYVYIYIYMYIKFILQKYLHILIVFMCGWRTQAVHFFYLFDVTPTASICNLHLCVCVCVCICVCVCVCVGVYVYIRVSLFLITKYQLKYKVNIKCQKYICLHFEIAVKRKKKKKKNKKVSLSSIGNPYIYATRNFIRKSILLLLPRSRGERINFIIQFSLIARVLITDL